MNSILVSVFALILPVSAAAADDGTPTSALPSYPTDVPVADLFTNTSKIVPVRTIGEFRADVSQLIDQNGKVTFNGVVLEWSPFQTFCPTCGSWLQQMGFSLGTGLEDSESRIGVGFRWAPLNGKSETSGGHLGVATALAYAVKSGSNLNARLADVNAYVSGGYGWVIGHGWVEIMAGASFLSDRLRRDNQYLAGASVLVGGERIHFDLETGYHLESLYSALTAEYMVFDGWWLEAAVQAYWLENNRVLPGNQVLSMLTFTHHFDNSKPVINPLPIGPVAPHTH